MRGREACLEQANGQAPALIEIKNQKNFFPSLINKFNYLSKYACTHASASAFFKFFLIFYYF
ncbi:hypothetical protein EP607_08230 [Campylobacter upsaliensis]|nr:hypothetical protein [Campylobacter upsaliensis]EAH6026486.1 hypothetical protein [Campylobacter upsaliensis]EAH6029768.1 hypothetical protein [Campylobacter upsaliensis]EAH7985105.1 hypothetical protein [Campylobacter upsaliensis]EAL3910147.1 hypothetical protein [Campylobacter upsaliensis]